MSGTRLFWQIFPSSLAITLVAIFVLTWYSTKLTREFYLTKTSGDLQSRTELIRPTVLGHLAEGQYLALENWIDHLELSSPMRITVILPDGRVVADSDENPRNMDNHATRPEIIRAFKDSVGTSIRFSATVGRNLMYVALPLHHKGQIIGVLRTALSLHSIEDALRKIQSRIMLGSFVVALATILISLIISRRISLPLEIMTKSVDVFASGNLGHRLSVPRSQEMSKLARSLNQMAWQLAEQIRTIDIRKNEQQAVLQSMAEGILAVDNQKKIIILNKAASRFLNIDKTASIGQRVDAVLRHSTLYDFICATLEMVRPHETEVELPGEQVKYLQVSGSPMLNDQNKSIGAVMVLNDVTRLRRLEQVRRDFVANVSHEIRTPLTSIKGFVETLREGAIENPVTAKRFLEIIERQAERLNMIIEDLLLLARLEQDSGDPLHMELSLVRPVIEDAIRACTPRVMEKKVEIIVECPPEAKVTMSAALIEQAVINLIDNALKYSEDESKIEICCEKDPAGFYFHIRDNGMGISEEHLPRLFERFYRVDKARSRKMGGTGLGLAIVKHIIGVHHGRIDVKSELGKGSTFSIFIPAYPAA